MALPRWSMATPAPVPPLAGFVLAAAFSLGAVALVGAGPLDYLTNGEISFRSFSREKFNF